MEVRDRHIPDLVSLARAAEMLGVSKQAVHKMVLAGRLHGARVDGERNTIVFRRVEVERWRERG